MIKYKHASVSIVLGTLLSASANTYAVSLSYPDTSNKVGDSPRNIKSENLDGLHQNDIVISNLSDDTLTILLSDGAGGYNARTLTTANGVGDGPFSLALGDVDGDTDIDIAVGNFNTNTVSVFLNNGSGTFTAAPGSPFKVSVGVGMPHGVDIADINVDTHMDIITANLGDNSLSILQGNGAGDFGAPVKLAAGTAPYHVRAADVDGDMDSDLIVPNNGDNTVTLLLNNGAGTLMPSATSPIAVGAGPRYVEVAQVVGPPNPDIVVVNTDGDSVTVLQGDGAGGFTTVADSPISVGDKPNHVSIGDLDGDNDNDLVTTNEARASDGKDTLSVLVNNGVSGFAHRAYPRSGERMYGSVIVDLDGDAKKDIALVNADDDNMGIYTNVGAGLPPKAVADGPGGLYTTGRNIPLKIPAPGILANDSDNESAILFATNPTVPLNGELRKFSAFHGSFTYRPNPEFVGIDSFTYTINDGSQNGNTVTVKIQVQ